MTSKTGYAPVHRNRESIRKKDTANSRKTWASTLHHGVSTLPRRWTDDWLQEYICAILGVGLVIGLVAVLLKQDGRPPPQFGSAFGDALTLNTVIAIIAAAAKTLLLLPVMECIGQLKWLWFLNKGRPLDDFRMFDQASTGLFGGLTMIWKTRLRTFAVVGVFVIVLGIAIDPFTQQLVTYSTEQVSPATNAIAPIAICWNDDSQVGFQPVQVGTNTTDCYSTSADSPARFDTISSGMKGAILQGVYSSNSTIADLAPICPSGNCTFENYASLAVCASVEDVTSHLTNKTIHTTSSDIIRTYVSAHQYINESAGIMNVTSAATSTPYDPGDGYGPIDGYQLQFNDSIAFANTPSPLADAFLIVANSTHSQYRDPPAGSTNGSEVFLQNYLAYEFMLEWCVENYSTTVVNGVSTTQRLGNTRNFEAPHSSVTGPQLYTSGLSFNSSEPVTVAVGQDTHYSLQKYLQGLLDGSISGGDDQCWTASSDAILCLYEPFQLTPDPFDGDTLYDVFTQLSINGTGSGIAGLKAILDNTATSMSNYVRSFQQKSGCGAGLGFASNPSGVSYVHEITVRVRWPWIIAHVVLACLSLLLLAVTVVVQRRSTLGHDAWKTSSLATLHAIDVRLHDKLGGVTRLSELAKQDDSFEVRLVHVPGEGWRLTEVE